MHLFTFRTFTSNRNLMLTILSERFRRRRRPKVETNSWTLILCQPILHWTKLAILSFTWCKLFKMNLAINRIWLHRMSRHLPQKWISSILYPRTWWLPTTHWGTSRRETPKLDFFTSWTISAQSRKEWLLTWENLRPGIKLKDTWPIQTSPPKKPTIQS